MKETLLEPTRAPDARTPRKPLTALSVISSAVLVTALVIAWNTAQAAPSGNVLTPSGAIKPRFATTFPLGGTCAGAGGFGGGR